MAPADLSPLRFIGSRSTVLTWAGTVDGQASSSVSIPHADIDTSNGGPIKEIDADDGNASPPEDKTLDGTPVTFRITSGSVQCGDRKVSPAEGSITINPRQPDSASSAVPLDVGEDGKLDGLDNIVDDGLSFGADAHLTKISGPQPGEDGPWVVSDGQTLAAVDSEQVLWSQQLDPSTAEVTGFGDERVASSWAMIDGTLIIGTSDGAQGIDIASDDRRWTVAAEAEGFAVSGTELHIRHDGSVSVFDFTDSADDPEVVADKGFDISFPVIPAPKLLTTAVIRDATVEIPTECAEFGGHDGSKTKFTKGRTSEGEFRESVAMRTITPSIATPKPLVAVEFGCHQRRQLGAEFARRLCREPRAGLIDRTKGERFDSRSPR